MGNPNGGDGTAVSESTARDGGAGGNDSGSAGSGAGSGDVTVIGGSGLNWGAGNDANGGSGDGSNSGKRKRGRPRKRRDDSGNGNAADASGNQGDPAAGGSSESSAWEAPRVVGAKKRGRKKKGKFEAKHAQKFVSFLYAAPALAGYGDHWRLEDDEAKDLGNKLHEVVNSMEGENPYLAKMMEVIGKVGPWVSLAGTAAIITMPRIAITKAAMMEQRMRKQEREPEPEISPQMNGNSHAAYSSVNRMGV